LIDNILFPRIKVVYLLKVGVKFRRQGSDELKSRLGIVEAGMRQYLTLSQVAPLNYLSGQYFPGTQIT
jgi:hypothetical protein